MFGDRLTDELIIDDRVFVNTQGAVLLENFLFGKLLFFVFTLHDDLIFVLTNRYDFFGKQAGNRVPVDHSLARNSDNIKLVPSNFVFGNVNVNIARITPFGRYADFFLTIGKVVCQINAAVTVPCQLIDILGLLDKTRLIHHGDGPAAKSDHHIHPALR